MADTLKNIVRFVAVPVGVPTALPHGLNIEGRALTPDLCFPLAPNNFDVTADDTNVTVTNNGNAAADIDVYVEFWHTIDRVFGPHDQFQPAGLTPRPFVPSMLANAIGFARFDDGDGRGSVNGSNITGWSLAEQAGVHGVTLVASATDGDSFSLAFDGMYGVQYTSRSSAGAGTTQISIDTSLVNIGPPRGQDFINVLANPQGNASWMGMLTTAQIIWAAVGAGATINSGDPDFNQITIARLA